MVRQFPQVLVYSNGALGRPWMAPSTSVTWEKPGYMAAWTRVFCCMPCGSR